jgi:ribosome-associated toxin RatA of RatAB toxin-antitoxin module
VRTVSRSAIVSYTPAQMFDLVAHVERYPEFLPWCITGELLSRDERELRGSITMAQGPLHGTFTTRNEIDYPRRMTLELEEGPFSDLIGEWRFEALGEAGCRISLDLRFAFSNKVKDALLGVMFEQTCNKLVDAFVQRAAQVYG